MRPPSGTEPTADRAVFQVPKATLSSLSPVRLRAEDLPCPRPIVERCGPPRRTALSLWGQFTSANDARRRAAERRLGQLRSIRDRPRFGDRGDLLVMFGDFEHSPLRQRIVELLRNAARLFRAAPPVRGVVQKMLGHIGSTTGRKLHSSIDQGNPAAYRPKCRLTWTWARTCHRARRLVQQAPRTSPQSPA
jgi:hypothetical protein